MQTKDLKVYGNRKYCLQEQKRKDNSQSKFGWSTLCRKDDGSLLSTKDCRFVGAMKFVYIHQKEKEGQRFYAMHQDECVRKK